MFHMVCFNFQLNLELVTNTMRACNTIMTYYVIGIDGAYNGAAQVQFTDGTPKILVPICW